VLSLDFLTARLEKLKTGNEALRALDIIRQIRYEVLSEASDLELISDRGVELSLQLYERGIRPFENTDFQDEIYWDRVKEVLLRFLKALASAGLRDGGLHALIRDLEADTGLARHVAIAALEPDLQHLSYLAAKYGIEAELFRYLVTTPLWPIFKAVRGRLPYHDNPVPARRCLLCGSSYTLGVYRASIRNMLCTVCGHRVHVDFFWCPNCGNEEPQSLGFLKVEEEPALQVEYCRRCRRYYKFVDEDAASIFVEDPVVLDLSTVDLDQLGSAAAADKQAQPGSR
jgi:formate dehydrogenase maturation protein FdhE